MIVKSLRSSNWGRWARRLGTIVLGLALAFSLLGGLRAADQPAIATGEIRNIHVNHGEAEPVPGGPGDVTPSASWGS